jgi:nitrogen regulatory protein PII
VGLAPKTKGKAKAKGKAARTAKSVPTLTRKFSFPDVGAHLNLITCILQRGLANKAAHAAMDTGAAGATILPARGMGLGQLMSALGHGIIPQKEVILIVANKAQSRKIFDAITKAAELDKPGHGIAFTSPIFEVSGMMEATHMGSTVS